MMLEIFKYFLQAKRRWQTLRDEEALKIYQYKKAKEIVDYAVRHSSFYHNHWQGCDLNDWRHLPIVNKSLMMDNFGTFNTFGIKKGAALKFARRAETSGEVFQKLTYGLSSGTSGERGLFVVNNQERAMWAGVILARVLHQFRPERIALFLRANSNLYKTIRQGRFLQFRYFDVSAPLEQSVQLLNTFQSTILVAPPSLLTHLALEYDAGHLRIQPERLISVAEMLEPQDKAKLENSFEVPVHQIYQATEGLLAISCQHGSLHLQEDLVTVQLEPLGKNHFIPIITDLHRKTQPIIRYDLSDVLYLEDERCSCGNPWRVIKQIEGRKSDLIEISIGQSNQYLFPDEVRQSILSVTGVLDYAVIQKATNHLHVYLETSEVFNLVVVNVEKCLEKLFRRFNAAVKLEFTQGLPKREATTKRRRIIGQQLW
jgi:putative adenylate-forming enzyme